MKTATIGFGNHVYANPLSAYAGIPITLADQGLHVIERLPWPVDMKTISEKLVVTIIGEKLQKTLAQQQPHRLIIYDCSLNSYSLQGPIELDDGDVATVNELLLFVSGYNCAGPGRDIESEQCHMIQEALTSTARTRKDKLLGRGGHLLYQDRLWLMKPNVMLQVDFGQINARSAPDNRWIYWDGDSLSVWPQPFGLKLAIAFREGNQNLASLLLPKEHQFAEQWLTLN